MWCRRSSPARNKFPDVIPGDPRRMRRKDALHPFAVGNPPHRKRLVLTATFPPNDNAGENLDALFVSLDYTRVHAHAVANAKLDDFGFELTLLDGVDDA